MASHAQITANQLNAQLSTGPKTEAGKAAVSQNRTVHGLAGNGFFILPHEDPAAYAALHDSLRAEHKPGTPTETFLIEEMARAQWKLRRVGAMEAAVLARGGEDPYSPENQHELLKLARYENAIRRNWYRALHELRAVRRDAAARPQPAVCSRAAVANATMTTERRPVEMSPAPVNDSKPMPAHLVRELAAHQRRDPDFDVVMDASQLSKELRRWFEKNPPRR